MAGYSSRMGTLKALLPWGETNLVNFHIDTLRDVGCEEIVVVTGYRASEVECTIKNYSKVTVRHNPNYATGRVSSIKCGVSNISIDHDAIVLIGVDQPRNVEILSILMSSHERSQALITSPRFEGRGGHPAIFSASLKSELLNMTEMGEGLRQIFNRHREQMNSVLFDDPLVRLDLNSVDDYEQAYNQYCL